MSPVNIGMALHMQARVHAHTHTHTCTIKHPTNEKKYFRQKLKSS